MKKRKKTGRPTKYKKTYCQALIKFFDAEPFEDVALPHYKGKGKDRQVVWTDFKRIANKLPTLVQFAKSIGVGYPTVWQWQNDGERGNYHKEFEEAYTRAKELQKDFLLQNGLQGLYNPIFAKFTAINITDMIDSQERVHEPGDKLVAILEKLCQVDDLRPESERKDVG